MFVNRLTYRENNQHQKLSFQANNLLKKNLLHIFIYRYFKEYFLFNN